MVALMELMDVEDRDSRTARFLSGIFFSYTGPARYMIVIRVIPQNGPVLLSRD